MYFSTEPMESKTYLDNQYFIILSLSTLIPHGSNSTMAVDAFLSVLELFFH